MSNTSEDANSGGGFRQTIAIWIIAVSGVGLVILAVIILAAAYYGGTIQESAQLVFNTLVPLFATWVGTVLAYYFSQSNFETANKSVSNLVDRLTPEEVLKKTMVRDVMLPAEKIKRVPFPAGGGAEAIPISQIRDLIDPEKQGFTRCPILDGDSVAMYVIHRSLLFEYLAKRADTGETTSLGEILREPRHEKAMKAWAVVALDARLDVAKRAMEAVEGAQDVFVTSKGRRNEPVVGWLTNVDITRAMRDG